MVFEGFADLGGQVSLMLRADIRIWVQGHRVPPLFSMLLGSPVPPGRVLVVVMARSSGL